MLILEIINYIGRSILTDLHKISGKIASKPQLLLKMSITYL